MGMLQMVVEVHAVLWTGKTGADIQLYKSNGTNGN